MQYSVPPRLMEISFGPKPSENVSTLTPMRLAIRKWPSSCTKISTPRTKRNARVLVTRWLRGSRRRLYPTRRPAGEGASPSVDFADIVEAAYARDAFAVVRVHRSPDDV